MSDFDHELAENRPAVEIPDDQEMPPDEPRMILAVQEYLAAVESGQRPNRTEFVAAHPDISAALGEYLDALDFLQAAAPSLDKSAPGKRVHAAGPSSPVDMAIPLGDFRILREIGRGGMGVVYEAEQLSLGRRIALKVLPFAWTLDSRQLQRFKNEARSAAHLHHSHIVPVYSVGCDRGVHFYAMQFIEGRTLADVIRELRELAHPTAAASNPTAMTAETATETAALATAYSTNSPKFFRTVAEFGLQAAEALEHAHQYGVVHRDIKPGNLLLDVRGHLWVTDFGLAQFPSDAALTMTGDLVGTLRYMSPEQALARRGLVDHRTDIYSLGVTLHELLTLEPVYNGRDRVELLRQIAFEEPQQPRRHNPAIPVDLETIILKSLAKSVEDRYASAQDLADDLRRFLDHEPIRARRPPLTERLAKWTRRHRAVVAASAGLLLLAAIGFAVSTALIAREQWKTQAAYEAEALQRGRAEKSFQQARQVVDLFTEMSEEELADKPELQGLRRKLLQTALAYYQDFIEQRKDDPSLHAELAASHLRVAGILDEIGSKAEALAAMERAQRIQEKLATQIPSSSKRQPGLTSIEIHSAWRRGGDQFKLLGHRTVQEELKLTVAQVARIDELSDKRRELYRDLYSVGPEEWRAKAEQGLANVRALLDGLRPDQAARLSQITLQKRGPHAFGDAEVADSLGLTAGQREKVRAIEADTRRIARESFHARGRHGQGPPARASQWKRHDEFWHRTRQQLLDVLTPDQNKKWNLLLGAPFDFSPPKPPAPQSRPNI